MKGLDVVDGELEDTPGVFIVSDVGVDVKKIAHLTLASCGRRQGFQLRLDVVRHLRCQDRGHSLQITS